MNTEDLTELYVNGPRIVSSDTTTILLVATPERDPAFCPSETIVSRVDRASIAQIESTPVQHFSFLMGVAHVAMDGVGGHMSYQNIFDFTKTFSSVLDKGIDDVDELSTAILAVVVHLLQECFIYLPVLPWSWIRFVVCVVCVAVSRHVVARVRR